MNRTLLASVALVAVLALGFVAGLSQRASAQITVAPRPENLRYRVIGNEPLSGGNSIVPQTQAWMIKDVKNSQCYTMFFVGGAGGVTGPTACPE